MWPVSEMCDRILEGGELRSFYTGEREDCYMILGSCLRMASPLTDLQCSTAITCEALSHMRSQILRSSILTGQEMRKSFSGSKDETKNDVRESRTAKLALNRKICGITIMMKNFLDHFKFRMNILNVFYYRKYGNDCFLLFRSTTHCPLFFDFLNNRR